jgi:hypothetical protein
MKGKGKQKESEPEANSEKQEKLDEDIVMGDMPMGSGAGGQADPDGGELMDVGDG